MVGPGSPQVGGMATLVEGLLHSSLARRFPILFLNIAKPRLDRRRQSTEIVGYRAIIERGLFISAMSYAYSFGFFFKYLFYLIFRSPRIIHIHTASYSSFWEKAVYVFIARMLGRKIVLHSHGGAFDIFYRQSSPFARSLIRKTLRIADRVIVLSESWKKFYARIVPPESLRVIRNGIPMDMQAPRGVEKTARPSFLYVGRLSEKKGVYDLIRAVARIRELGHEVKVFLMGGGELRQAEALAETLDVADLVRILGPRQGEEKWRIYFQSWGFVLPSYFEGLPMTLIEAFAAGLPVVATDVGAIPTMVRQGENGYLMRPGDIEGLARAMISLAKDDSLRAAMGRRNREIAERDYSLEKCAERIAAVYEELK